MEFTDYMLPNGTRIPVDSTACKHAPVTTFTTKGGDVVFIVRADLFVRLQTSEPHVVGMDAPTSENDPQGRFR
jgi:hypothetical protein